MNIARWAGPAVAWIAMLTIAGAQIPNPQFPPPMIVAGTTIKVAKHSYVIPDGGVILVPNVGIVVGDRATLVVDTGMGPRNAQTVLAEVAKVSRNQKMYLVATHAHAEHVSGLSAFPPGTTFIVSKALQEDLEEGGARGIAGMSRLTPVIGELLKGVSLRPADIVFDREYHLDLGGVRVRLLWLGPTHTRGDTLAFVEGDRTLFAGDVVLKKRFPSFGAQSSRRAWLDVLDRVATLHPRVIVPSHGEIGDASLINTERRVLNEMQARVAALKAEGRTMAETSTLVSAEFKSKYPDWQATVPNEIGPIVRSLYAE